MALEMRPDCERCGRELPADAAGAMICSLECTFCDACSVGMGAICPNCGGGQVARPVRPARLHEQYPPSVERRFKG